MIDLKKLLAKILSCPMVVETGTVIRTINNSSSINCTWKYRKWSDGTCDLWGTLDQQTYAMTAQSGYGYYTSFSLAFPTFANSFTPLTVFAGRLGGSNGNSLMTVRASTISTDNTYVNLWVYDWSNPSIPCTLCAYVHGTYT